MLSLIFACHLAFLPQVQQTPSESLRIAVTGATGVAAKLQQLGYAGHDVHLTRQGQWTTAELIVLQTELPALRQALPKGTLFAVLERSRPYREIAKALRMVDVPDPLYRTPQEVETGLRLLEQTYPNLCKVYDLQTRYQAPLTLGGRKIFVLRISDNPSADEDEPKALLFANNHSRELNSIEAPFHAAEQLLAGYGTDPALTKLVDDHQIWILPNMNPDGLDYVWNSNNMWRKNRRDNGDGTFGVDLNRNYRFFWGQCGSSSSTSSTTYRGPAEASEPETQAMEAFALTEGFERLIDIHSYSQDIRHPFNPLVINQIPLMTSSFYASFQNKVAQAMTYKVRGTCCCGTHMEWHHAANGTLTYLVEMGTSFQPPFKDTQRELALVWPGLRTFLEEPVPLRGRVRSLVTLKPLLAEITVAGQAFVDGQKIRSVGRHGRYQVWASAGTCDVTYAAPGHTSKTVRLSLKAGSTLTEDVFLEPVARPTTLTAGGAPRIGNTVTLQMSSPDDAGKQYFMPASFSPGPAIPLGYGRSLPIGVSFLIDVQLLAPTIFVNTFGTLDIAGKASAQFRVPNDPNLSGLSLYFAAVVLDPTYPAFVKGISGPVALTITL